VSGGSKDLWNYLEMEGNKRKDEGFQILNEVVENSETFGVCRFGHIY
jgi:hypothetical protein